MDELTQRLSQSDKRTVSKIQRCLLSTFFLLPQKVLLYGIPPIIFSKREKWTESPAVRDPAFRIFEAGKEEAEIVTLTSFLPLAEIPVRKTCTISKWTSLCTGIKPAKRYPTCTPPTISAALGYGSSLLIPSPEPGNRWRCGWTA